MKEAILEIIGFDVKDIITTSEDEGLNLGGDNENAGGDLNGDFEWLNNYDSPYGQ